MIIVMFVLASFIILTNACFMLLGMFNANRIQDFTKEINMRFQWLTVLQLLATICLSILFVITFWKDVF